MRSAILFILISYNVFGQIFPMGFISKQEGGTATVYDDTYTTIGTQKWLDHDFDITTYNDGTAILYVANAAEWASANTSVTGAWCYAEYDLNTNIKLYNYYAINNTSNGGLIPNGWHLPTQAEYETMISFIGGGGTNQALKLMSPDFISASTGEPIGSAATNEFGFNALRTKYMKNSGTISGFQSNWWTATVQTSDAYYFKTETSNGESYKLNVSKTLAFGSGLAIRLLKD